LVPNHSQRVLYKLLINLGSLSNTIVLGSPLDFSKEEFNYVGCIIHFMGVYKLWHLAKMVHYHKDGMKTPMGYGQTKDKVHNNIFLGSRSNRGVYSSWYIVL